MGWAKYHEDDYLMLTERLYSQRLFTDDSHKHKILFLKCPYCDKAYTSKPNLYKHIKEEHGIIHPIIRINNSVVKNDLYVAYVDSAVILRYGYQTEICINNRMIPTGTEDEAIDISEELNKCLSEQNECLLSVEDTLICIHKLSAEFVRFEQIQSTIDDMQNDLLQNHRVSMQYQRDTEENTAEQRYLDGAYNYFLACQAHGQDKINRYNDAYSILKQFSPLPQFGKCILKTIAFRFNWVQTLSELCDEDDDFKCVCCFLKNEDVSFQNIADSHKRSLYIEDEIQDVMDAIKAYQSEQYGIVTAYLKEHPYHMVDDRNLRDKILLLNARMSIKANRLSEASKYYSEIVTDDFQAEVEIFRIRK